ncbi:pore-forming ESAT-6 family protein [Nesterenkonia suensis]
MSLDRISFDTGTSGQVQGDIDGIVSRLEALIGQRDQQVAQALADFQMDGADEEYRHVETRWNNASNEVKSIIALVRQTLSSNDQTATTTQSKTRSAISNIG